MKKQPIALICEKGHCITNNLNEYPSLYQPFCNRCGSRTISTCPSCNTPIKGDYYQDACAAVINKYLRPLYCHNCGKAYPWTTSAVDSTYNSIIKDKKISLFDKIGLRNSLHDLTKEGSKTATSAMKIKRIIKKSSKLSAEILRQFVIDFGCELSLKLIGFK